MPGSTPQRQAGLYLRRRITRRWARTSISATSASSVQPKASSARPHFGQAFLGFLQIHYLFLGRQPIQSGPTVPPLAFLLPSGSAPSPWGLELPARPPLACSLLRPQS